MSGGSAVEKLKQIPDVLNREFLRDSRFSVLPTPGTDHRVASITFSRNCAILIKKDADLWDAVDGRLSSNARSYRRFGDPLAKSSEHKFGVEDSRDAYRRYRSANTWQVADAEELPF